MLKKDLEKLIGEKNIENYDLSQQALSDKRKIARLENELKESQNKLSVEVNRGVEIRNAIETIAAVKFHGALFDQDNAMPTVYAVAMPSQSAEPDELLALRHLYKLTGW